MSIADKVNDQSVPTQPGEAMWRVSNVQRFYQSHVLDQEARASS